MRIQDEIKFIIKPNAMKKIGLILIQKIQDRTEKGIDEKGEPFKEYSSRTFALPAGAVPKRARTLLMKNGLIAWYSKPGGKKWILVKGGYANLKMAIYAKTSYFGEVNLTQTGDMLRQMRVVSAADNEIKIGFGSTEAANKAYWNHLRGRDFLGIMPEDWEDPEIDALLVTGVKAL